jgi:hypothetical protein
VGGFLYISDVVSKDNYISNAKQCIQARDKTLQKADVEFFVEERG